MHHQLLFLIPLVAGLSVNVPKNPVAGTETDVTWNNDNGDPSSWVFALYNAGSNYNLIVATASKTTDCADVDLPMDQSGDGYTFRALDVNNNQAILAESPQFSITASKSTGITHLSSQSTSTPKQSDESEKTSDTASTAEATSSQSGTSSAESSNSNVSGSDVKSNISVGAVVGIVLGLTFTTFFLMLFTMRRLRIRRRLQCQSQWFRRPPPFYIPKPRPSPSYGSPAFTPTSATFPDLGPEMRQSMTARNSSTLTFNPRQELPVTDIRRPSGAYGRNVGTF